MEIAAIPFKPNAPGGEYGESSILQTYNYIGPIGAYVTVDSVNDSPLITNVLSMVPFLSVVETKPVESLLDIYWETSLSGNLVELNALVDSQYGGLIGSNFSAATFSESITDAQTIGSTFNFTDGSGSTVTTTDVTINNWSIVDGSGTPIDSTTFSVAINFQ
jgi:hypothetical protein